MSGDPLESTRDYSISQADLEKATTIVQTEFQVEETLLEQGVPSFYLRQGQETKQAFLRVLRRLGELNLVAVLRRVDKRVVLRIIPRPPVKPSRILVNWILFFATIGTTFVTGYTLAEGLTDPLLGGAAFTISIMTILGLHEFGHKVAASKKGVNATAPYFIPGPPPISGLGGIGTFGAVIVQKSLPPNKDALFDIGWSGPVMSFLLSILATSIGLLFSPVTYSSEVLPSLPVPLLFWGLAEWLVPVPPPLPGQYAYILLHPVAFAGWVGMIITMLNLLPAAMLDGGHVSRALFGEKIRLVLTALSIVALFVVSPVMAFFVLFMAAYRHPGPLDDVSKLSTSRKLTAVGLLAVLVLCSYLHYFVFYVLDLLSQVGLFPM